MAAVLVAAGCSPQFHAKDADREVYGIVADKHEKAFGRPRALSIDPDPGTADLLKRLYRKSAPAPKPAESLSPEGGPLPSALPEPSADAVRLSMAEALKVAVRTSRNYQTEKEKVYLAALVLTFERYLFRPHPFATGTVNTTNDEEIDVRTWDGSSEVGLSQQLADGAVIVGSLGLTALKFINKELGDTLESTLDFSLTQPLWRGAGRKVVQENLFQVERNTLYAVRTFGRFEKTLAVNIATDYLGVLQKRDTVLNEWRNYQSLIQNREQAEWLAQAERRPAFEVDQARQEELKAYNRWIVARESYENALDEFKILLGVSVATEIRLDPAELERLTAGGLEHPDAGLENAVAKALATRLDLANARDGLEDAKRKIKVAEDGLKGDVDLVASIGYKSQAAKRQGTRLAFHEGVYSIGFEIDLPVDRLSERNALRETQIDCQRAARSLALQHDQVILDVRKAFRKLGQARQSYEIQKHSAELGTRRVESTQLLLQAGRLTQRDVLESQQALVEARNALTRALVDHTIAYLEFQRDVGTLVVNEEGQIGGWNLANHAE